MASVRTLPLFVSASNRSLCARPGGRVHGRLAPAPYGLFAGAAAVAVAVRLNVGPEPKTPENGFATAPELLHVVEPLDAVHVIVGLLTVGGMLLANICCGSAPLPATLASAACCVPYCRPFRL